MKPIRLTMQAFGSYGKKTVIDFTKPNQNLFLVTGDTGAGKTTIFDAMVYALYDDTSSSSGKIRSSSEMQSQYAGYDVVPFVEFIFSENIDGEDRIFTVKRSPRHIENKKKGQGTTSKDPEVILTLPDGSNYNGKKDETDKKIAEITGLSKSQFMQTGMIAQGEFMEVLRGETKDKKPIFSKLFNTGMYQEIVDELKNRKDIRYNAVRDAGIEYRQAVAGIKVPDDYADAEMINELKRTAASSENINAAQAELLTEKMNLLCDYLEKRKGAAENEAKKSDDERIASEKRFTEADTLRKSFEQLKNADAVLAQCRKSEEETEQKRILSQKIEYAYEISAVFKPYDESEKDYDRKHKAYEENAQKLPELNNSYSEAAEKEKKAKLDSDKAGAVFTVVKKDVESAKVIFNTIREAENKLDSAQKEKKKLELELKNITEQKNALSEAADKNQEELNSLSGAVQKLEMAKKEADRYSSLETGIKQLTKLQKEIAESEKEYKNKCKEYESAAEECESAEKQFINIRRRYFDSQAGLLARELRDNTPCPVCGSLSHPSPCRLGEEMNDVTQEDIEKLEKEADNLRKKVSVLSEECGVLKKSIDKDKALAGDKTSDFISSLTEYIPDLSEDISFECAAEKYTEHKKEIAGQVKKAEKDEERFSFLNGKIKEDSIRKTELENSIKEYEVKLRDISDDITKHDSIISANSGNLKYTDETEADTAFEKAQKEKDEAEKVFEKMREDTVASKERVDGTVTLISEYEKAEPEMLENIKIKKNEYQNILAEKKLTEDEWKKIVSSYSRDYKDELVKQVNDFEKMKLDAESTRKAAENSISGKSEPDYDKLMQEKEAAKKKYDDSKAAFDNAKELLKANKDAMGKIIPVLEKSSDALKEYTIVNGLYERLSGRVSGSKMDIETFVQRYYLERILESANIRLQNMSAGQYELRMFDAEEAGKGRTNRGLELKVYSTVTCKEREVGTLSGGESFMAALALSLGMADQIQANTSAINLDVMFIDEGFGSLDDHSRNQAIRVLQQMAGSSKMIGIISHVTELKHEIDNQLVVTKDNDGSHAEWMIS